MKTTFLSSVFSVYTFFYGDGDFFFASVFPFPFFGGGEGDFLTDALFPFLVGGGGGGLAAFGVLALPTL